jgi:pyruvate dehydrogenase E1 component
VIIQEGLRRMVQNQEDVYYYITLMNENYSHPEMPKDSSEGILKGLYCFKKAIKVQKDLSVELMGSGVILREVIAAAELLERGLGR